MRYHIVSQLACMSKTLPFLYVNISVKNLSTCTRTTLRAQGVIFGNDRWKSIWVCSGSGIPSNFIFSFLLSFFSCYFWLTSNITHLLVLTLKSLSQTWTDKHFFLKCMRLKIQRVTVTTLLKSRIVSWQRKVRSAVGSQNHPIVTLLL